MINVQSNNIARGGGQAAGVVSKEYRISKDDTYVSSLFLTAATKPDNIIKVRRSLKKNLLTMFYTPGPRVSKARYDNGYGYEDVFG